MTTSTERPPVGPGEPAPAFTLPAVGRDGTVSLDDYRGRSPVLLALFRGLYCPFCRRAIAECVGIDDGLPVRKRSRIVACEQRFERRKPYAFVGIIQHGDQFSCRPARS